MLTSTNDNGTGQSSGGSTTVQTPEETNSTSIESGSIVDTETGVTYYFTKTTTTNLNVLLTAKTSIMSATSDLGAYIKTDGTIEIKKDVAEAVTASIKTSLYKDEVIKNTKWYKDEKHTDLASEKAEINEVESTTYHAESVLEGSTLKTTIKSAGYTASKTVDVRQYFDAKTQLDSALTAGGSVDFSSRVAAIAKRDALSMLPSGATLSDSDITLPSATISIPSGYEYDYQSKMEEAIFNVKMSDIRGQNNKFDGSIVNTDKTNEPLIYGVSSYIYNDDGDDMRAMKFADTVKKVDIDLESKNINLIYMYAAGVVANNATISLSNANNATLSGNISTDGAEGKNALKDSALLKALKTSSTLPTFAAGLTAYEISDENQNLYDTGINEVIDNYYNKGVGSKMNPRVMPIL